jgi:hypothetical protein
MSTMFMVVELYYQRGKSWSNRSHCKYICVIFSYIYSCSLLNIVILKPSLWFVHLHCPDCFIHFEQRQEEGGAIRVGSTWLGYYAVRMGCRFGIVVYMGVSCPPVIVIALKSSSYSAVIASIHWIVKDSRSNESPLFAEGWTRVRTMYSRGTEWGYRSVTT